MYIDHELSERLYELTLACSDCERKDQLARIFSDLVCPLLPHRGVLLLLARRKEALLKIDSHIALGYEDEATANALSIESTTNRKALQYWLSTGIPLVIDLPADSNTVSSREAAEIQNLKLGRIAAHGVLDPRRQLGSYMTYARVDPLLPRHVVAQRLRVLTPPLHQAFMNVLSRVEPVVQPTHKLSASEISLIKLLAAGKTNAEIAKSRCRSANTVRNQLATLFAKLNASNRAEAVARAHHVLIREEN